MKKRLPFLLSKKKLQHRLVMTTAYDFTFASIIDECDVDVILVGDSLGNVFSGYETTLPVTLDELIYHAKAVRRAVRKAFLVADLPFMSYQVSPEQALQSAGRVMKEACVDGVKIEGGSEMAGTLHRLVQAGIPVVAHIGFTPQSEHLLGGYIIQGKDQQHADRLFYDAQNLQQAGASMLVLELMPSNLAQRITEALTIPTIGVGAGKHTDGQCLVIYDLLGFYPQTQPKFLKKYANLHTTITQALQSYAQDIQKGTFPSSDHSY